MEADLPYLLSAPQIWESIEFLGREWESVTFGVTSLISMFAVAIPRGCVCVRERQKYSLPSKRF